MDEAGREARELLLRRRRQLVDLYGSAESAERGLREARNPDWVDQASEEGTAQVLERLSEREHAELGEIDAALARIEQGVYGVCQECGGPIEGGRLRVMPEARRCVACSS